LNIRKATRKDVPALGRLGAELVRLHHQLDPRRFIPASPETERGYGSFLATQLDDEDAFVIVAEEQGSVIGYAYAGVEGYDYMSLRGPAGVLHDIVVDPSHRGQGVGRTLLDAALEMLKARDVPRVVLSTAQQNVAAQRLFASAGFRATMIEMTKDKS